MTATAACLAAGLALIGTGELMHRRGGPVAAPTPAPIAAQSSAPDIAARTTVPDIAAQSSAPDRLPPAAPEGGVVAVTDAPSMSASASRPEVRRIAVKRTKRPTPTASRPSSSRPASRGVLDRLRLGWLRNAFSPRSSSDALIAVAAFAPRRFGVPGPPSRLRRSQGRCRASRLGAASKRREGGCHII